MRRSNISSRSTKDTVKKTKYFKTCRICMVNTQAKMVNLFQYNIGNNVANAFLMRICDVKIIEGDGLPTEICTKCLRSLKAAFKFKTQCEYTDRTLREKADEFSKYNDQENEACEIPLSVKTETYNTVNNHQEKLACDNRSTSSSQEKFYSKDEQGLISPKSSTCVKIPSQNDLKQHQKLEEITEKLMCYRQTTKSTAIPTIIIEQPLTKKIKARKNATCAICYQKFEDYEDYRVHVRKHSGEVDKPYKCKACGKGFLCVSQLNRHLFTHSDVKLYECSICKKGFNNAAHMKSHMYVHTGEKPYICSLCNKGFNQMPHLKRHLLSHDKSIDVTQKQ